MWVFFIPLIRTFSSYIDSILANIKNNNYTLYNKKSIFYKR